MDRIESLIRIAKHVLRSNAAILRELKTLSDDEYYEYNDSLGATPAHDMGDDDGEYVGAPAKQTSEASILDFTCTAGGQLLASESDEIEEFLSHEDAPAWAAHCYWGIPPYMWDSTVEHLKGLGQFDFEVALEALYTWTVRKIREGRNLAVPFRYAVCAANNLQSTLLGCAIDDEGTPLIDVLARGSNPEVPGLTVIQKPDKRWLLINWYVIGHEVLGLRCENALLAFESERSLSCDVGVCDKKLVKELDKRFKRGVALDLSELID